MFPKFILSSIIVLIIAVSSATAEMKFVRPGESPSASADPPDMGALDLGALYRGIDLLSRVRSPVSRGTIVASLMNDFAKDDIDGNVGITDADRKLAARVEISRKRAREALPWAGNDLDGDGSVTRYELMVVSRTKVDKRARGQGLQGMIELTDKQRSILVLEYVTNALRRDLDGDDVVTYAEAVASVDVDRIMTRFRTEGGALKPIWDADDSGAISKAEVRLSADRLLDLIDANSDNVVDKEESKLARQAFLKARARAGDPSRGKRVQCSLPTLPMKSEVIVIQGEAGSAVTNLAFENPRDQVVRMAEVVVPKGETELYLIASMRSPTVLRISGSGAARVKAVVGVAAQVALTEGDAKLANTPCHQGFLGIRIVDPGGVAKEFARALGRDDVRAVISDRLGRINLGTLTNESDTLLQGDALPVMKGDGQVIIDRFLSFDPGGFQMLDPSKVQSTVPVRARELPPLEIGLIVLASQGKIEFAAPPPGFISRDVPAGIKREVPEGEATDGVIWLGTPGGASYARFPLTIVVRRAIDLPAGLTTERGVRIIVPDGVPKPRGAKNLRFYKG